MRTPDLFRLLEHYLDKLADETDIIKEARYEEYIDFITEMIVKDVFA